MAVRAHRVEFVATFTCLATYQIGFDAWQQEENTSCFSGKTSLIVRAKTTGKGVVSTVESIGLKLLNECGFGPSIDAQPMGAVGLWMLVADVCPGVAKHRFPPHGVDPAAGCPGFGNGIFQ